MDSSCLGSWPANTSKLKSLRPVPMNGCTVMTLMNQAAKTFLRKWFLRSSQLISRICSRILHKFMPDPEMMEGSVLRLGIRTDQEFIANQYAPLRADFSLGSNDE